MSSPYPSPNEARTRRAKPSRTGRRHRRYTGPQLEIIDLASQLRSLAEQYPRFRQPLNKLKYKVELQLTSSTEKERRIRKALVATRLLTLEELECDTSLDVLSLRESIDRLVEGGDVHLRDRNGQPIGGKGSGKGWRSQVYYELRPKGTP